MKIAWVSPFAKNSAIGHYSTIVCDEIAKLGYEIVRVRLDAPAAGALDPELHKQDMTFAAFLAEDPGSFDRVIYNLGNSYENHGPMIEDGVPPGIFILHDVNFPHIFYAHCAHHGHDAFAMLDTLVPLGLAPEDHRAIYANVERSDDPDVQISLLAEINMVGWITRNATRLVVHSPSVTRSIAAITSLPVDHLPLAFWSAAQTERLADIPPFSHDRLTLSSFGHLVANKRVSTLIRSIGSDAELSKTWQLRIVGPSDDAGRKFYTCMASKQPHPVEIVFTGQVDDATFEAEMRAATCISCLRRPSYESGSATLVLAMAINGNVLVSEDSASSGIVEGMATMIPTQDEYLAVAAALRGMTKESARTAKELSRIRSAAREMFDARNYAVTLMEMLETPDIRERDVIRFRSLLPADSDFATALRRWCGSRMISSSKRIQVSMQRLREIRK